MTFEELIKQAQELYPQSSIQVDYDPNRKTWSLAAWFVSIKVNTTRFGYHYGYSDESFDEAAQMALDRAKIYYEKTKQ
jgi:hypothetical protein